MRTVTRPIAGAGITTYPWARWHSGAAGPRPASRVAQPSVTGPVGWPMNMSGPMYAGMDPSDPLTYVRQWNPTPGMVGRLNFDGAALQGRTPRQVQRGSQRRPKRLRISP